MKTNNLLFIANLFESLTIATALILPGAIATAKAQDNMPAAGATLTLETQNLMLDRQNLSINGLFTPTAAQRFYEAGREDFERETKFLTDSERYFSEDILQIDTESLQQIWNNKPFPELKPNN
ncbi:hypothetical protein [Myxosarcina sp. GI1]|uniref:hypothetical protein n=1 Tax=Myxosarcina sp. GI1 TaxID=1541065 RepID=UPI00055CC46E|nr:hypothetical protein [Myxosarcina sp. GI1]